MTRVVLGSDSAVIDLDRARRVVSDVTRRARQLIRWQSVRTDEERLLTVPPPVQRSAQSVLVQRVVDPTSLPRPDHERPAALSLHPCKGVE